LRSSSRPMLDDGRGAGTARRVSVEQRDVINAPRDVFGSFETGSAQETRDLGERLGGLLRARDVVLLFGELGAGKTVFAKGIASGVGIAVEQVTSPSFTLMNVHEGRVRMIHLDLYRIETFAQAEQAGLLDVFNTDAIVVVEWPEKIVDVCRARARVEVRIYVVGPNERRILISEI